jgi:hypothetical protein
LDETAICEYCDFPVGRCVFCDNFLCSRPRGKGSSHPFYPDLSLDCYVDSDHKGYVIASTIALVYYIITSLPFTIFSLDTMVSSPRSRVGHTTLYEALHRCAVFACAAFGELLHVTHPLFIIWLGFWTGGVLSMIRMKWNPDINSRYLNNASIAVYISVMFSAAAAWAGYSHKHKFAPEIIIIVGWTVTAFVCLVSSFKKSVLPLKDNASSSAASTSLLVSSNS